MANATNADIQRPPWNSPFAEQVAFFRQKLNLPTERWDDIVRSAHDKAFIVAGAQSADLLNDLNAAIAKSIEQGTGLEAFRKDFKALVKKNGWTGWTGEGRKAGVAWRTKVIYQTNMSTSYAAGRWRQLSDPALLKALPYWQYRHSDSVIVPRPLHVDWHGLTLPPDHAFWTTHFPPNGWGCHCRVIAVSKAAFMQAVADGRGPANAPAGEDAGGIAGIDSGFDYAPGAQADTSYRQMVQDKLINYPPAITKALTRDANRYLNAHEAVPDLVRRVLLEPSAIAPLWLGFVENDAILTQVLQRDVRGYLITVPPDVARYAAKNHGDDATHRTAQPDDYRQLATVLNAADSLRPAALSRHMLPTVMAIKLIAGEIFTAVFEVQRGKNSRALSVMSFVIQRSFYD